MHRQPEWDKSAAQDAILVRQFCRPVWSEIQPESLQARHQLRFSNDPKALAILNPVIDAVYNKNTSAARTAFAQAAPQVTAALQAASAS